MKTPFLLQLEQVLTVRQLLADAPANKHAEQIHDELAKRAYELFCASGGTHGHDLEDWCQAESQLLKLIRAELEQNPTEFTVRTQLPGFAAEEIGLWADSRHLLITAKHAAAPSMIEPNAAPTENQVFRTVEFPSEIDAKAVTAFLTHGEVEVILPRIIVQDKLYEMARAA